MCLRDKLVLDLKIKLCSEKYAICVASLVSFSSFLCVTNYNIGPEKLEHQLSGRVTIFPKVFNFTHKLTNLPLSIACKDNILCNRYHDFCKFLFV